MLVKIWCFAWHLSGFLLVIVRLPVAVQFQPSPNWSGYGCSSWINFCRCIQDMTRYATDLLIFLFTGREDAIRKDEAGLLGRWCWMLINVKSLLVYIWCLNCGRKKVLKNCRWVSELVERLHVRPGLRMIVHLIRLLVELLALVRLDRGYGPSLKRVLGSFRTAWILCECIVTDLTDCSSRGRTLFRSATPAQAWATPAGRRSRLLGLDHDGDTILISAAGEATLVKTSRAVYGA